MTIQKRGEERARSVLRLRLLLPFPFVIHMWIHLFCSISPLFYLSVPTCTSDDRSLELCLTNDNKTSTLTSGYRLSSFFLDQCVLSLCQVSHNRRYPSLRVSLSKQNTSIDGCLLMFVRVLLLFTFFFSSSSLLVAFRLLSTTITTSSILSCPTLLNRTQTGVTFVFAWHNPSYLIVDHEHDDKQERERERERGEKRT